MTKDACEVYAHVLLFNSAHTVTEHMAMAQKRGMDCYAMIRIYGMKDTAKKSQMNSISSQGYGSGVWIACGSRVSIRTLHVDLPYLNMADATVECRVQVHLLAAGRQQVRTSTVLTSNASRSTVKPPCDMWASVNMWYIAPSHQLFKSVLSFFRF